MLFDGKLNKSIKSKHFLDSQKLKMWKTIPWTIFFETYFDVKT